jgi:hypothetical protein
MNNALTLGDHAAKATRETMPCHIWMCSVEDAVIALGVSGDWLREPRQRERMNRAHSAGEPVWMAADAILQFWTGEQRAKRVDDDGMGHIRAAARRAK